MDKQTIEEMVKDMFDYSRTFKIIQNAIDDECFIKEHKKSLRGYAEYLYNAGYRKIPEGAVVLTSEMYSDYLITQTNNAYLEEQVKKLQGDNERLYKNIGKFKDAVRKETAEKIAERAKEEAFVVFMGEPIIRASKIDEICKELTEGN